MNDHRLEHFEVYLNRDTGECLPVAPGNRHLRIKRAVLPSPLSFLRFPDPSEPYREEVLDLVQFAVPVSPEIERSEIPEEWILEVARQLWKDGKL